MPVVTEWGMPYHVRVSIMIVFFRTGSLILLTQSQLVTGVVTTSPVSHNPGLVVAPLFANCSLLGSTYGGSRPVRRSVKSVKTTIPTSTDMLTFNAFFIFLLPAFSCSCSLHRHPIRARIDPALIEKAASSQGFSPDLSVGPSVLRDVPLKNPINVDTSIEALRPHFRVFLPLRLQHSFSFGAIRYQYHRHFVHLSAYLQTNARIASH